MEVLVCLGAFLLLKAGLVLSGRRKFSNENLEEYFLAGRNVQKLVLFFTFVATNYSAFFFMGFSGAGYRIGYAYYVMMAVGTAFAAFGLAWIGFPTWRNGKKRGYITPPEMLGDLTGSRAIRMSFTFFLLVFTIPYLSLQPIGAGYLLSALTDGGVPYLAGAVGMTFFICAYTFIGGMRSVAMTDLFQGVVMFSFMALAAFLVAQSFGGIEATHQAILSTKPELFSRSGAAGAFDFKKWFGFMILWLLAVPMFPQLFSRFFIGKSEADLRSTTFFYAITPCILFVFPVFIGMAGHLSFPGLEGKAADQILPMMLKEHVNPWVGAMLMTGALAAFMSTLDSQLLAMSTILTRDVYVSRVNPTANVRKQIQVGRFLILLLAVLGLIVALKPPATLFAIAKSAFTGFALLFPAAFIILRRERFPIPNSFILASIWLPELLFLTFKLGWFPKKLLFGFDPVVPFGGVSILILCAGLAFTNQPNTRPAPSSP